MGFFSNDCHRCGHPMLSSMATDAINTWMSEAVALKADGAVLIGAYDGYGGISGAEYATEAATSYHRACWELAGKPMTFQGQSPSSPDQGWFFDEGAHHLPDPRTNTTTPPGTPPAPN